MRDFLLSGIYLLPSTLIDHFESALNGEILTEKDRKNFLKGVKDSKRLPRYYRDTIAARGRKVFGYGFSKVYLGDIPLTGK